MGLVGFYLFPKRRERKKHNFGLASFFPIFLRLLLQNNTIADVTIWRMVNHCFMKSKVLLFNFRK